MTDLYTPNLIAAAETLAMPTDWSDMAGQVNNAVQWSRRHRKTRLVLGEGCSQLSSPINVQDGTTGDVELCGTGVPGTDPQNWGGGTVLRSALNDRRAVLSAKGANRGEDSSGMLQRVRMKKLAVFGAIQAWHAIEAAPLEALIDVANVAYLALDDVWVGQDYRPGIRGLNVWDSDSDGVTVTNSAGFSDPTVTADRDDVTAYTGRRFLDMEKAIKRSLGRPAIEIISPATTGGDVSNNWRWKSLRVESNASNAPALMIWGKNGSKFRFQGKIEVMEGCAPCVAVADAGDFAFDGEIMGGATGRPFGDVGGVKAGTPWANFVQPAIALFHNCYSPRLTGEIAHHPKGGKVEALIRAINCFDPRFTMRASDGLTQILQARMLFENCTDIKQSLNDCYAYPYLTSLAGANQLERKLVNCTSRS